MSEKLKYFIFFRYILWFSLSLIAINIIIILFNIFPPFGSVFLIKIAVFLFIFGLIAINDFFSLVYIFENIYHIKKTKEYDTQAAICKKLDEDHEFYKEWSDNFERAWEDGEYFNKSILNFSKYDHKGIYIFGDLFNGYEIHKFNYWISETNSYVNNIMIFRARILIFLAMVTGFLFCVFMWNLEIWTKLSIFLINIRYNYII